MKLNKKLILGSLSAFALAFTVACGNDTTSGSNSDSNNKQETQVLEGTVSIDGSSTVYPIMEAVSEEYYMVQPKVRASVGVSGTGGGFKAFIAGETDISNASRPIKAEEAASLEEAGIEYTEFEIAYDGLSIVVNKNNDWVDYLTIDELKAMWVEQGKTVKWSDIREGWPELEIKFYSPGTDSGTFDYFNEVILDDAPIVESATLSEDDNVLVNGVTGSENAIGYFGYAYYAENSDKLKVVPIVNPETGEAVEPTNETVENGTYAPLSRPLFIYVANDAIKNKPEVYDYVKFLLENVGDLAEEVGYVRTPQANYDEALNILEGLK